MSSRDDCLRVLGELIANADVNDIFLAENTIDAFSATHLTQDAKLRGLGDLRQNLLIQHEMLSGTALVMLRLVVKFIDARIYAPEEQI